MPHLGNPSIHDCNAISAEAVNITSHGNSHAWLRIDIIGGGKKMEMAFHDMPFERAQMYAEAINAVNEAWEEDDAA